VAGAGIGLTAGCAGVVGMVLVAPPYVPSLVVSVDGTTGCICGSLRAQPIASAAIAASAPTDAVPFNVLFMSSSSWSHERAGALALSLEIDVSRSRGVDG
jgi:hypothetical protein